MLTCKGGPVLPASGHVYRLFRRILVFGLHAPHDLPPLLHHVRVEYVRTFSVSLVSAWYLRQAYLEYK